LTIPANQPINQSIQFATVPKTNRGKNRSRAVNHPTSAEKSKNIHSAFLVVHIFNRGSLFRLSENCFYRQGFAVENRFEVRDGRSWPLVRHFTNLSSPFPATVTATSARRAKP
jgi:hypothetical protein